MRVYVCGPMAGKPNLNREAFERAAEVIRERGDEPILPHDLTPYAHEGECWPVYGHPAAEGGHDGGCYVRGDISVMVLCDYIYRLPGWMGSRGAKIETEIAGMLRIPIEDAEPHAHRCDRDESHRDMTPCHCVCGALFPLEDGRRGWIEPEVTVSGA